jgi:nucleotide-binding universal stress UspA family protein
MTVRGLRILLPLDGSSEAEGILAAVLPLSERRPLRLTLLNVIPKHVARPEAEAYLARAMSALRRPGVQVRSESCLGDPASAIVAHAVSERADLIAMTTHGRSGLRRLLLGSVTEQVLRRAPFPLITCRSGCRMAGWAHVVALDGSPRAESILDDVLPLTRLLGATLHLLHVRTRAAGPQVGGYLQRIARHCAGDGVEVTTAVREGPAIREILRYAEEVRAGLVALATHGRTGLDRALMGSVAEEVLRRTSCPLLLRREVRRASPLPKSAARALRPS